MSRRWYAGVPQKMRDYGIIRVEVMSLYSNQYQPYQPAYRPAYGQPSYQPPQPPMQQNWQQQPAQQNWQPPAEPVLQQAPPAAENIPQGDQDIVQALNRLCDILEAFRQDRKECDKKLWTSDR